MNFPKVTTFDISKLEGHEWYRQETASTPYFIFGPAYAAMKSQNRPYSFICKSAEFDMRGYYSTDYMRDEAEKALALEKENPGHFDTILSDWNENVRSAGKKLFQQLEHVDIEYITDEELLGFNKKIADLALTMWSYFYMEVFDIDAESLMERELVNEGLTLTDEERSTLMMQEQLIIHQQSERDLLKIVQMAKSTPGALNTVSHMLAESSIHRLRLFPHIEQMIQEYVAKYFWMYNSWSATNMIKPFDVIEQVKHILGTSRDIDEEYEQLNNYEKRVLDQKKEIADTHEFSDWLRRMFHFFGLLTYWRDARKAEMQKQNHWQVLLGKEIARRSNLHWEDVRVMDPGAIEQIPVTREQVDAYAEIARKYQACTWDGEEFIVAENTEEVLETLDTIIDKDAAEIRGMIACPGKATGTVVVIKGESDFDKMEDGAVLVTTMTRPEFVPLMKRASAIVTDEGGITSHAAVVSRELKVPCVIGTQVATQKLQDGDEVLVNANHGVVIVQE